MAKIARIISRYYGISVAKRDAVLNRERAVANQSSFAIDPRRENAPEYPRWESNALENELNSRAIAMEGFSSFSFRLSSRESDFREEPQDRCVNGLSYLLIGARYPPLRIIRGRPWARRFDRSRKSGIGEARE